MIITAVLLVAAGVIVALLGAQLFKLLLPVIGLLTGFMVGFTGFQAVFGSNAISTVLAIAVALVVGLVMAVLCFVFFDLAATLFCIALGAALFSYLGVALGLREEGFVLFLLSLAGAVLAGFRTDDWHCQSNRLTTAVFRAGLAYRTGAGMDLQHGARCIRWHCG